MMGVKCILIGLALACVVTGCAEVNPYTADPHKMAQLRTRALEALKLGVSYKPLPSVRANAVESFQEVASEEGLPWIRTGLNDEHPAVRFAACMALGTLRDEHSRLSVESKLGDANRSVRAAAIFALHRLGDSRYTADLAAYLRDDDDFAVRRNAALILGRLGEPGAVALLAGVVGSQDDGLHIQALEALVLLDNPEAKQQMRFVANSGNGAQEVLALNALAVIADQEFRSLYEYKLAEGAHLEVRLAAARALGLLGSPEGLRTAIDGIEQTVSAVKNGEDDSVENKTMRVRQLAALALEAIGDPAGLPGLAACLEQNSDPRIQVASARAILAIVRRYEGSTLPFKDAAHVVANEAGW